MRDNWSVKTTNELCEKLWIGLVTTMTKNYVDKGVYLVRNSDIKENKFKTDLIQLETSFAEANSHRSFKVNDVATVHTGDVGTSAVVPEWLEGGHGFATINSRLKVEEILPLYYSYFLNSRFFKSQVYGVITGDGRSNLNLYDFVNLKVYSPPLPQQRKIAKILSTCDTVIAKTEEAIAKYQAIKQGMMHDLFTRGIDLSTGKLRPKYQDAPELYKESELGMIPKDWEVKRLEEYILLLKSGLSRLLSQQDIGLPVLISGNIQGGKFDFGDLKYWYKKDTQGANTQDYLLDKGDILLCFINSIDQIGKSALFEGFHRPCIYTTNLFRIKASEISSGEFLFQLLNSDTVKNEIKLITKPAVNQASFTTKDFSKMLVPFMSKDEQNEIVSRIKAMDLKLDSEEATLSKYQQIKSGLMQDLLSGKVEVSVSKEEEINA